MTDSIGNQVSNCLGLFRVVLLRLDSNADTHGDYPKPTYLESKPETKFWPNAFGPDPDPDRKITNTGGTYSKPKYRVQFTSTSTETFLNPSVTVTKNSGDELELLCPKVTPYPTRSQHASELSRQEIEGYEPQETPKTTKSLEHQLSRFKIWSRSMGAHKTGAGSLDYRLRDATHIRDQVLSLIQDLIDLIKDASAIISGEMTPWDELEDELEDDLVDDEEEPDADSPQTELEQITGDVADVVNCLIRLNADIWSPAPHERFIEGASVDTSFYEPFDTRHVYSKFPDIAPWLADRLGKAISRRRHYFRHREALHAKISPGLERINNPEPSDGQTGFPVARLDTDDQAGVPRPEIVLADRNSDASVSQTARASSMMDSDRLRIPPPPNEAQQGPFQCPYCYMMIKAPSMAAWKRHVYLDLKPYTCLAEDCITPQREFANRREWMEHVQRNHWIVYECPYGCKTKMCSPAECKSHLKAHQGGHLGQNAELDAFVKLSEQPVDVANGLPCQLCQHVSYSIREYGRHVGQHQEQLALFALPSGGYSDDENDEVEDVGSNWAAQSLSPSGGGDYDLADAASAHDIVYNLPTSESSAANPEKEAEDVEAGAERGKGKAKEEGSL